MCIILHAINSSAATSAALSASHLREAWTGNPHGAGLAYRAAPGSRVRIIKGLMSADTLCAAAAMIARTVRPYEVAVHLRFATHGARSPEMCHPFATEWGALVHNGVMRGPGLVARSGESDTAAAARIVSRVEVRAAAALIRDAWLSGSRVLMMRHGADPVRLGDWHAATVPGLWLSQTYSLPGLVKRSAREGRQSVIWSDSSGFLSGPGASGRGSELVRSWGLGCDAEACGGDSLRDDVAAAQEAARIAREDREEEERERRAIQGKRAARRSAGRVLGMGAAAPAAVRSGVDRGDPETRAAVDALPPLPMSDPVAAADLSLAGQGDGLGQS